MQISTLTTLSFGDFATRGKYHSGNNYAHCCRKFFTDLMSQSSRDDEQDVPSSIESMEKASSSSSRNGTTADNNNKNGKPPTLRDIPKLTKDMVQLEGDEATAAAKRLYELCDVGHKQNRELMVASGRYEVINPLSQCLLHTHNEEKLHFVCLTLNNLSIPHDNKRVMVMERGSKKLIGNLCKVVASGKKDAYLCCIVLMNLSFLEPAQVVIGQFSPRPSLSIRRPKLTPLENPDSLLRILQELLAQSSRGTSDFRWAYGLLSTLSRNSENALLIGLTGIPRMAIDNIRQSTLQPAEWSTNSLEDFSLYLILHLAEASKDGLIVHGALEVAEQVMISDTCGIQGLKATMVCAYLELPWERFPDYGVIAAGGVSELMGNTFERVGKKKVYTDNAFSLRTAVGAYAALAKAAARADSNAETKGSVVHTKVVALPTAVALLFQIIDAIASHRREDGGGTDNDTTTFDSNSTTIHWDVRAGDVAVGAVMALLPALLEAEDPPRHSTSTQYTCLELSKVFVFFSKKTNSISIKARSAEVAEKLTESASGSAVPLLEASFDLWRHSKKNR